MWWLYLVTGIAWTLYGMFVLSLRPSTVASLAWFAGFAFIFGGISQFLIAQRVDSWQWLFYVGGVIGILAGLGAFVWPGKTLLVARRLRRLVPGDRRHLLGDLGVRRARSATGGGWASSSASSSSLLGAWAIGSPGRELLLLVNLVGIYMIFFGVVGDLRGVRRPVRARRESRPDSDHRRTRAGMTAR